LLPELSTKSEVKSLLATLRLTRPENLLMVVLTMLLMRYCVIVPILALEHQGLEPVLSTAQFITLIAVVVLVTAGGNIINDYFDQKVDKINKPDKVIVGKLVKRRVAMVLHHGVNLLSVGLCAILCIQTSFWWPLVVPILAATALWWYSPVLKKQPFIGNLVVAMLVAMVPLWTGWFEVTLLRERYADMMHDPESVFDHIKAFLWGFSVFAFLLTLAREAVKDMEDREGDRAEHYRTIILVVGEKKTRLYVQVLLLITTLLFLSALYIEFMTVRYYQQWITYTLLLVGVPMLIAMWKVSRARSKSDYHSASRWIKWVMLAGVISSALLSMAMKEVL
jgi:4-hydroxybenzoate polyprenyltransferase